MAVITLALDIEYAHEMCGGEPEGIQSFFVRGGHYRHAFWLAMQREAAEQWQRIICTEHLFLQHVVWTYWREVPAENGTWEYQTTTIDKGYPVTLIDMADLDRLSVPMCRQCVRGEHQNCEIPGVQELHPEFGLGGKVRGVYRTHPRWTSHNPRW